MNTDFQPVSADRKLIINVSCKALIYYIIFCRDRRDLASFCDSLLDLMHISNSHEIIISRCIHVSLRRTGHEGHINYKTRSFSDTCDCDGGKNAIFFIGLRFRNEYSAVFIPQPDYEKRGKSLLNLKLQNYSWRTVKHVKIHKIMF